MENKLMSGTINNLKTLLADSYSLYLKSQNYHWNLTGQNFYPLHKMLEEHYTTLAEAVDTIAERIKALGDIAPGSFKEFAELSTINLNVTKFDQASAISTLLSDHREIAKKLHGFIKIAEEEGDQITMDLIIERATEHEKIAWMLNASL
jgi:starvation-inducible DNA-binding protein